MFEVFAAAAAADLWLLTVQLHRLPVPEPSLEQFLLRLQHSLAIAFGLAAASNVISV